MNYFSERYKHKWSSVFKLLLLSGLKLKNKLNDVDYYYPIPQREVIQNRLRKLLDYPINDKHKELFTFQKRMKKYEDYIFTFLYHPKVPPDNNASERAIRNIKVKQKISGQFKSPTGGYNFAVLRSVTDTVIKNNQNIYFCTVPKHLGLLAFSASFGKSHRATWEISFYSKVSLF